MLELDRRGIPGTIIATTDFEQAYEAQAKELGFSQGWKMLRWRGQEGKEEEEGKRERERERRERERERGRKRERERERDRDARERENLRNDGEGCCLAFLAISLLDLREPSISLHLPCAMRRFFNPLIFFVIHSDVDMVNCI